jgi:hypothetical protein
MSAGWRRGESSSFKFDPETSSVHFLQPRYTDEAHYHRLSLLMFIVGMAFLCSAIF